MADLEKDRDREPVRDSFATDRPSGPTEASTRPVSGSTSVPANAPASPPLTATSSPTASDSESAQSVRKAGWLAWFREPGFLNAIKRLVQGAAFLAVFLVLEFLLTSLIRLLLGIGHPGDQRLPFNIELTVSEILNGLDIFSALGVGVLFIIHMVKVAVNYIRM